jgi:tetratricopeptide (TPR) repeat protein
LRYRMIAVTAFGAALAVLPACAAGAPTPPLPPWAADQVAADSEMANGKYQDAVALYERAVMTAEASRQDASAKAAIGRMLVSEGNGLLKLKRIEDAEAAYAKAAALSPNPATAYFNLCAVYYNNGDVAGALAACDKAIEFDPAKADAYFIKGSALYSDAEITNGKVTVPPAAVEALRKYLALAPDGPHASDVKAMLDALK